MEAAGELGSFPFGQPNRVRPMRRPTGDPAALIVGVYPSAFHIAWSPPDDVDPRPPDVRQRPMISSLAVDVEPAVFWDGTDPSPADELERWKLTVGFDPATHGVVRVGNNGPSGSGLLNEILAPLGIDPANAAYTDAVPWFFVKGGPGSQGNAITERFNPIARRLGLVEGQLPKRPTARALVNIAASSPRRDRLRQEVLDAGAPLVVTLGQEALDVLRGVAHHLTGAPSRLDPHGYGSNADLIIGGRTFTLLPLAHPGFLRQTTHMKWRDALTRWKVRVVTDRVGRRRPTPDKALDQCSAAREELIEELNKVGVSGHRRIQVSGLVSTSGAHPDFHDGHQVLRVGDSYIDVTYMQVDSTSPQPWRIYDSLEELHLTWTIATDWETGVPEGVTADSA